MGKSTINGPFSIAMLDNQRVYNIPLYVFRIHFVQDRHETTRRSTVGEPFHKKKACQKTVRKSGFEEYHQY